MFGEDQKRALLAVVLSGVVFFGWQYFFIPKKSPQTSVTSSKAVDTSQNALSENQNNNEMKSGSIEPNKAAPIGAETFELKNQIVSYTFNNALLLQQASNINSSFTYDDLFQSKEKSLSIEFKLDGNYENLLFDIKKISDTRVEITNVKNKISGTMDLDKKGFLHFNLKSPNDFKYQFSWNEKEEKLENGQIKNYTLYSDSLNTFSVGEEEVGDSKLLWAGIDFNYHLLSIVFPTETSYLFKSDKSGKLSIYQNTPVSEVDFKLIFTKKEYDTLLNLGSKLHLSVDFGLWSLIAVPILRGLQFFYDLFPNWGISIILLTFIIRTLTFPLQYKSFKSMKKMQVIQPELTKIREKFKEDPQRMQKETMSLFKQAGANPLGGCLPMVLQMPIFFAFYKVLYSSVELVQAPFIFWIHDLSEKDPYYVLPVLMAAAMFLHQKVTPTTTADPVQKKVMMFMPLVFAIFMKDLPAGLTLYIFVSTILGLLQQLFVYKRA